MNCVKIVHFVVYRMEIDTKIGYKEAIKAHEMHILIRTIN